MVLESCFHDRSRIPAHLYAEGERFDRSYGETLRVMRAVATPRGLRPSPRRAWLARAGEYTGPVLVIWGREDGIVPAAHLKALRESYPAAELHTIRSAGHLVMPEQPDAFAGVLRAFLDRTERPGPHSIDRGVAHQER